MAEGFTDENGIANFTVEGGNYSWNASKEGYTSKSGSVTVTADVTVNVVLESEPALKYTLTLILKDPEGNPIQNVRAVVT